MKAVTQVVTNRVDWWKAGMAKGSWKMGRKNRVDWRTGKTEQGWVRGARTPNKINRQCKYRGWRSWYTEWNK